MKEICGQSREGERLRGNNKESAIAWLTPTGLKVLAQKLIGRFDQMPRHYESHHSMESS
jgi:hypothetical protein